MLENVTNSPVILVAWQTHKHVFYFLLHSYFLVHLMIGTSSHIHNRLWDPVASGFQEVRLRAASQDEHETRQPWEERC